MSRPYSLVVVDDHRFIRESIIRSIDWAGLGVEVAGEAKNGLEAKELILRLKPDIVVTDIKMPGMEGLDLAEKLGHLASRSEVIVITGFQEFEYAVRALRLGVVDFVLKPIKNDDLIAAVRKAIRAIEGRPKAAASEAEAPSYGLLVDSMLAYIDLHFAEDLTLDRLAAEFKVHPSHASRIIAKASGAGFVQQVNRRRIAAAQRLLADPSLRIKEIVVACGFSDYSYFLKVFREIAGCAPQAYRAGLGAGVKNDP